MRINKNGEEEIIYSDWYFENDITDAELHLLIDSLLFSKYIPYNQCKEVVEKLKNLSSKHFRHKSVVNANQQGNKQFLLTIEVLNEAIEKSKQVSFHFIVYGADKETRPFADKYGTPHSYRVVSPYEIVVTNGKYYLICAHNKGDTLFNYRLDYMCDAEILKNERRRPISEITGYKNGLDLSKYMKEHIYMYSGKSVRVTFRADKMVTGQIIDWFGGGARIVEDAEDTVIATVTVSEQAMVYWALQYGMSIEVLEPESLRQRVREAAKKILEKYEHGAK